MVPADRDVRLDREGARHVVTLTGNFDVFAPCVPTGFAAIFLARGDFTDARDMRALGFVPIFHLKFSPFPISVLHDNGSCSCELFTAL